MKQDQMIFNSYKNIVVILITIIGFSINGKSQTSVFQDAKGESAFKIFGSAITLNAKDQSLSFSSDVFKRDNQSHTKFNRFGLFAKVTANEGIAALKNETGFLIDGETGIYLGERITSMPGPREGWAHEKYFSANILIDRNKLYNITNAINEVTYNKGNIGWKLEVGWFGYTSNWLWGMSGNLGQKSNVDDLKQDVVSSLTQTSNNISILKQTSAYNFSELKTNLYTSNFNADAALLLNRVATTTAGVGALLLGFHIRYNIMEDVKPSFNPAIGLYISKPGAPKDVVAGLNFQLEDAFNVNDADKPTWKRIGINLTAGFKID